MALQDFAIKKRKLNIILGLLFLILAIKLPSSMWTYVFYTISALLFVYTDQIMKKFSLSAAPGKYKLKGNPIRLIWKDRNGNVKDEK